MRPLSTALRANCRTWRNYNSFMFVTEPEKGFSSSAFIFRLPFYTISSTNRVELISHQGGRLYFFCFLDDNAFSTRKSIFTGILTLTSVYLLTCLKASMVRSVQLPVFISDQRGKAMLGCDQSIDGSV